MLAVARLWGRRPKASKEGNRESEGRRRRCELWGFRRRRRILAGRWNAHKSGFRKVERGQGVFCINDGIGFFAVVMVMTGARSKFGRAPAARSNDQRQKRGELRRCGRRDLDHDVSILISKSEEPRGARPRSKVSTMIRRPPQHGHGCARMRVSG